MLFLQAWNGEHLIEALTDLGKWIPAGRIRKAEKLGAASERSVNGVTAG